MSLLRIRCEGLGVKPASVLFAALVAAGLSVVPAPFASAGPGGDAVLVVQSVTIDTSTSSSTHVLTRTTMCPAGSRATGGGAYPVTPANSGTFDNYRTFYSAPVDESGLAINTDNGDVPRGWQVSFNVRSKDSDGAVRYFAICSVSSDAVIVAQSVSGSPGVKTSASVPCPAGSRAVGGGMGKTNDGELVTDYPGTFYESSPVDSTGTVSGTQAGDVATAWRSVATFSGAGNRFFAICSASSDATIATASFTVAATSGPAAGLGSASCPAGRRALSGGLSMDAPPGDDLYRPGFGAPVAAVGETAGVASGAVARSFLFNAKPSENVANVYRVFVVCASDSAAAPADTTPADTAKGKGPAKKTHATKAKFTFSSEAGATFTCRLDKKQPKACSSPYKVKKLKPGKHKLVVTATDAAGNADPTPAVFTWKVLKRKPKPAPSGCTGECRA